jgi:hypothetical protein
MTKVEAVKALLKANGGTATWAKIYAQITRYYPEAKASAFWQEGIRGIVYREMRYKRSFKFAGKGVIALR